MALFWNRWNYKRRAGRRGLLGRYLRDRSGNIAAIVALMIVPLVGVMGIATEATSWFLVQRSMQNAADSAAIAAASNANPATYQLEAKSVAANFGFTNGVNNTTVTAINTDNSVPAVCSGACYRVTITRNIPIYLTRVVGYSGTVALGTGRGQTVSTFAVASPKVVPLSYCLISLGPGDSFHISGGNTVNLDGCYVRANGDSTCDGTNSSGGATEIIYTGNNKNGKCSPASQKATPLPDPYSGRAANIPANTCTPSGSASSYPQEAGGLNTKLTGNITWGATKIYCGDVQLTGNVNLTTASPGTVLVIENGKLDLGPYTLTTLAGSGLTVIFTGPTIAGFSPSHILTGSGDLNIAAPTSGTWSGIAVYQDPVLTSGVDMSAAGNAPTWDITGLIYLPKSNLQFKGVVNKATNGVSCFALVDYTFVSKGTGTILEDQSQCAQAGLTLAVDGSLVRVALIQ